LTDLDEGIDLLLQMVVSVSNKSKI